MYSEKWLQKNSIEEIDKLYTAIEDLNIHCTDTIGRNLINRAERAVIRKTAYLLNNGAKASEIKPKELYSEFIQTSI